MDRIIKSIDNLMETYGNYGMVALKEMLVKD